jgi:hypothetical protein
MWNLEKSRTIKSQEAKKRDGYQRPGGYNCGDEGQKVQSLN